MAKWFITTKRADFEATAKQFHISSIVARILRNRDLITAEEINLFLNGTLADLHNPHTMRDIDLAVSIITEAIATGKKIRIVGDYDIDGVCASYILLTGLQKCGADVDVRLPNRIKDGYGINESIIEQAHQDGVQLVVTCDNGIAAFREMEMARVLGMKTVVTDHHEVPYDLTEAGDKAYQLPPADAVVNPHQEGCSYPYAGICGAVVAYKLIEALYEAQNLSVDISDGLLEFAAIATVGDVMELLDENRIIVKYGLERIRTTQNIGLRALIDATQIDRERLSTFDIGFILGPCINATGRLDTAERALELFRATDQTEAVKIANELKDLNDNRKELTKKYQTEAINQAEKIIEMDKILVIYLPDCHESLAGIIAGRIKERYYRPTFVLTGKADGVKGSGRSIEAYHMYEEMSKCRDLFKKYGGHKMAAGLSIKEEHIEEFRKRLNEETTLTEEDMQEKVQIDIPMPITYASKELIKELEVLKPHGIGNPGPLFAEKDVKILSARVFGKNQNVVKLLLENSEGSKADGIWFGDGSLFMQELDQSDCKSISVAYYPTLNVYMGRENVQLNIQHYLLHEMDRIS